MADETTLAAPGDSPTHAATGRAAGEARPVRRVPDATMIAVLPDPDATMIAVLPVRRARPVGARTVAGRKVGETAQAGGAGVRMRRPHPTGRLAAGVRSPGAAPIP